jgi:hypothetical protein
VKDTTFYEGRQHFPALSVSSKCPLFLLVNICSREGKALGNEGGKELGSEEV